MSHPLLAQLASLDPAERANACRSAAQNPAAVLLLDGLELALGDRDPVVARTASDALVTIGSRAAEVDPLLRRAIRSDRPNARWAAAFARARLGPPTTGLLPPLVEAFGSESGDVRWRAARLMVEFDALLPEVRPLLAGLAAVDTRASVRQMAVHCLRELATNAPEAAGALTAATQDDDARVRRAALAGLAALGQPAPAVGRHLLAAASEDPDPACRRIAVHALREVARRQPGSVPAGTGEVLAACSADSPDEIFRGAVARTLRRLASPQPSPEAN